MQVIALTCVRHWIRISASENEFLWEIRPSRLEETFPRWSTTVTIALHMYSFVSSITLKNVQISICHGSICPTNKQTYFYTKVRKCTKKEVH